MMTWHAAARAAEAVAFARGVSVSKLERSPGSESVTRPLLCLLSSCDCLLFSCSSKGGVSKITGARAWQGPDLKTCNVVAHPAFAGTGHFKVST